MKVYEILSETTTLQEALANVIRTGFMKYQVMKPNGILDPKIFMSAKNAIQHKSRFYMTKSQRDAKIAAKQRQGAGGEVPLIKGAKNKISPLGRTPDGKIYTIVDGQRRYYSSYADYFRKNKIWGPSVAAASKRTAGFFENSWLGKMLLGLGANLTVPIIEWRNEVDSIHAGYVNGEFTKAEAEEQIKYRTDVTVAKFVGIFLSLGAARLVAAPVAAIFRLDRILPWMYGKMPSAGPWMAALDKPAMTALVQYVFMKEPIVEDLAKAVLNFVYKFTPYKEYGNSFWNQLFQVTGYEMVNGELDKQRIARTGSTAGMTSGQTKPPTAEPEDDAIDFGQPGTANRLIKKWGLD
jgi:hypothetical protein